MKIATLKSDFIGSSIFFAIIVSFGSYILWYVSPLIIIPFILILIMLYLFVLYSYFDIDFYEDYFMVKRVIGKTKINMKYESIKEAKFVYSQGRGNVLFNIKFQKNDINLNNPKKFNRL
ncbi:MAG: hypothetical protein QM535_20295 [Limnohabitans sp.]|nr:hypothetical protein [Limnohabitans sp.]